VRRGDTYTLLRYRAGAAEPVNPAQLAATSLDGSPSTVLVTP
jgi:hypothetical protein